MNRQQESRIADRRLRGVLSGAFDLFSRAVDRHEASLREEDFGRVDSVSRGVVRIKGLPGIRSEELIRFPGPRFGLAFNLDPGEVAAVLLDAYAGIQAGAEVHRTGRVADVPVGEALLGRVIDPLGRPLDRRPPPRTRDRLPAERPAPALMARAPVEVPLQTGLLAVDALIPIGRGQRELILGDRQTGKTAIALDTIINQRDKDVVCVYCSIGREASEAAKVVADLRRFGAMDYSIIVVATGEDPPGVSFLAPYAATSMAEFFTERGQDALIVYDDLTRHARSYRELSLLLRRPPAREAYPGDIFYIHSRLLERASHLRAEKGGGSLTALPIIETQAENLSAYIPTNLISITDGQIYLSPKLFGQGILPAIDVGQSVSRVGGKTQLPGYRAVSGSLRLSYSQFKELETFARFGTRLDEETRRTLERGRRVQEVLKQPRNSPVPADEQLAVFLAVTGGVFDEVPLDGIAGAKESVRRLFRDEFESLAERIRSGEKLSDEDKDAVAGAARKAVGP